MTVHLQENLQADGLSNDEFMTIYHNGEITALDGYSMLNSPHLDDPKRLSIWMLGYMEQPLEGGEEDEEATSH